MQKLTSVPNLGLLSQKLANPPLNLPLHFLIGIPFLLLKKILTFLKKDLKKVKRGSLLGNEELDLGGDSPIFEIIYPNLEQRSIFAKKLTHFSVIIKISLK